MTRPKTSVFALALLALAVAPASAAESSYGMPPSGLIIDNVYLTNARVHSVIDGRGVHVAAGCDPRYPQNCGGGGGGAGPGGLKQITVEDLKTALDLANAQTPPDARHAQCWSALIPFVEGVAPFGPPSHTPGGGLATAAQAFFDLQGRIGQPLFPDAVLTACGPTVYDLKIDFLKLAAALGVAVVSPIHVPVFP